MTGDGTGCEAFLDKVTRGKTRGGRLDALDDVWLEWLGRQPDFVEEVRERAAELLHVDLGFGATPQTARDFFGRITSRWPGARCVGVEIDPERVAEARKWEAREPSLAGDRSAQWVCGGFELDGVVKALSCRAVAQCRAMNVLRQYDARECHRAHARMLEAVMPGGYLLEGSCDRHGARLGAHILQRGERGAVVRRGVLWVVRGEQGHFAPRMMRDWLPQDLRRNGKHAVHEVLRAWMEVYLAQPRGARISERFAASAYALAAKRSDILAPPWLVERGGLIWMGESD